MGNDNGAGEGMGGGGILGLGVIDGGGSEKYYFHRLSRHFGIHYLRKNERIRLFLKQIKHIYEQISKEIE